MHRSLLALPALLSSVAYATAISPIPPPPLPLIIWHGLGDKYDNDGLHQAGELAQKVHPGTYVHYVRMDADGNQDRTDSFFGNVTEQVDKVCADLRADPRLRTPRSSGPADGRREDGRSSPPDMRVDAMGFSQGGQFLRGLLQRCDGLRVRSLVTFGSQHNGIAQFQTCGAFDFVCKGATALIQGNAWTEYVQGKVVPAQYYRPINTTSLQPTDDYLAHSGFLADVNNEREVKQERYREKIRGLDTFAMYVFEEDSTVIPKESGWFAEVNRTTTASSPPMGRPAETGDGTVIPLRNRTLYTEDWLGLRALDEQGGLIFESTPGAHMHLTEKVLADAYRRFFGPDTADKARAMRGGDDVDGERALPLFTAPSSTQMDVIGETGESGRIPKEYL